ncbi:Peptidoglycan-binding lysin domain [Macleaya cordata]|uniref:Peptidoglycan-binding lysin domain n=1 Tax=Macleaya cordata TaxID=56857 RepID=A0A200QVP8_MACCD|nr:Peptidoglycan-binding lysin domain [Macleaya cordata]
MSTPRPAGSDGDNGKGTDKDKAVAKTAGFVVFSGIAMSILRALNPCNQHNINNKPSNESPPLQESKSPHYQEPTIIKESMTVCNGSSSVMHKAIQPTSSTSSPKTIEIVKGDTLWGLSRKYGVSIDALKEANGLTGDKIYAGKKLVIP